MDIKQEKSLGNKIPGLFYALFLFKIKDDIKIPILNQRTIFVGTACPGASGMRRSKQPGSSVSSTYVKYASSSPPGRLNIIFDLEVVENEIIFTGIINQ
ncbi:hypothetical protein ASZ90_008388 [hydrocarbon metagenome]|uniref:Uncharacterized protein n=1 Tax=hydrocarbon metagenome TaxID=938273 RepID=A0A0W8FLX9_9ZZZZ